MEASKSSIWERMVGAALLDASVYEEVEADRGATGQAAAVVAMVAAAAAVGASRSGTLGIIAAVVAAFVSWLVWSGLTYLVGTRLFGGTADWGELLRTLGFAQTPGIILLFAFLPFFGGVLALVVWIWQLVAGVVAIRQALDFDTGKAIGTALVAYLPILLLKGVLWAFTIGMAFVGTLLAR